MLVFSTKVCVQCKPVLQHKVFCFANVESEMQKYDQHYPSTICKVGDVTIFAKYF